jgi:hypothetical protein
VLRVVAYLGSGPESGGAMWEEKDTFLEFLKHTYWNLKTHEGREYVLRRIVELEN